ncbi:MAG: transcriptional regulator [Candidatus Lindowbacteria bacterium RIFCSPLOWO2_12_FULL_62_27]|nr:MAG: transcriptional regulator [Candidatus Lindowbacteria bacterium RIFCSPLOWO2_12_FULL_62_27]OGH63681.1 MAG: transcriptional regulator [Candidatus Lindowbacteria bacterium RIFCSPLOWO2_02_FULL_62_12]
MAGSGRTSVACCPPKPKIGKRPLIGSEQSASMEAAFKVLANGTRLRMLHALVREPDLCVGDLAEAVGVKTQAVSNQLRRLVDKGIVASRRNGTQMHYRIVDPCVVSLLDQGLCLTEDRPSGARTLMSDLRGARR